MTLGKLDRQRFAFFWAVVMIAGLLVSKFLVSIAIWLLIIISCFSWSWMEKWPSVRYVGDLRGFRRAPVFWVVTLSFFVALASALYSPWTSFFWDHLRVRIPYLILPIAFYQLPVFTKKQFWALFLCYIIFASLVASGVLIHYMMNYRAMTIAMGQGRHIPVPVDHIRFSLHLAFCVVAGLEFLSDRNLAALFSDDPARQKTLYRVVAVLTFFLFVALHIFSVRTGLLGLYACLIYRSLLYVYRSRRWATGAAALALIAAIPLTAYRFMPAFRLKVDYTLWDWGKSREGAGKDYSDSERLVSMEVGRAVGDQNPWIGVGLGSLPERSEKIYAARYPGLPFKTPHNQFIFLYAATGLVGVGLFIFAFFFPLLYRAAFRSPLFLQFHLIVFLSLLSEDALEVSIGIVFYVFWLCVFLNQYKDGLAEINRSRVA